MAIWIWCSIGPTSRAKDRASGPRATLRSARRAARNPAPRFRTPSATSISGWWRFWPRREGRLLWRLPPQRESRNMRRSWWGFTSPTISAQAALGPCGAHTPIGWPSWRSRPTRPRVSVVAWWLNAGPDSRGKGESMAVLQLERSQRRRRSGGVPKTYAPPG